MAPGLMAALEAKPLKRAAPYPEDQEPQPEPADDVRMKRAIVRIEEEFEAVLLVSIGRAEDVDGATRRPEGDRRIYHVITWVNGAEDEYVTEAARGLPNPMWEEKFRVFLGRFCSNSYGDDDHNKYLHLEVLRVHSKTDPGSSTGIAIVGRARIPLPKEAGERVVGRYGLVVPHGVELKAEGHIIVSMELKRRRPPPPPFPAAADDEYPFFRDHDN